MDVSAVLSVLAKGKEWSLVGDPEDADQYASGLHWTDESPAPTWSDLEAAWPSVSANLANDRARLARLTAFRDEADPLFFGWQRGENTEQEWLDKCEEIRQRFPYVPVPPLS